jgi:molybdenum-dependent DNA-binding transcriptional regulator ModE
VAPRDLADLSAQQLLGRLHLRHLLLLIKIDEYGNLHRAAEAMHMMQSAATVAVQQMEAIIGAPLFDRWPTKGMRSTPFCAPVLEFAKAMMSQLDQCVQEVEKTKRGFIGTSYAQRDPSPGPDHLSPGPSPQRRGVKRSPSPELALSPGLLFPRRTSDVRGALEQASDGLVVESAGLP